MVDNFTPMNYSRVKEAYTHPWFKKKAAIDTFYGDYGYLNS